jgi:hypothetical protein
MGPRADTTTRWEELARRFSSGLEVTLLWHRDDSNAHVRVIDVRTEEAFELTVAGENALEAFTTPTPTRARTGDVSRVPLTAKTVSPADR